MPSITTRGLPLVGDRQRRPPIARLAAFFVVLWLAWAAAGPAWALNCAPDRIDRRVTLLRVLDGDTLLLKGGERLRLIGVDTPELGRDGAAPEPQAVAARDRLRLWLAGQGGGLGLRLDRERRDRHGRLLAHVYTQAGASLSEWLLAQGLGYSLVVPPNDWRLGCRLAAQAQARRARLGLWGDPAYRARGGREITGLDAGLYRLRDRIVRVGRGGGALWLNVPGKVAIRIPEAELPAFGDRLEGNLVGHRVEVLGRFQPYRGELRLSLRHPDGLLALHPPALAD